MSGNKPARHISTLVAAVFLTVSCFAGCSTGSINIWNFESKVVEETASAQPVVIEGETLEPVKLTWYMIGTANQPDEQVVFAAANKRVKEKINAEVHFAVFDWGEYDQKIKIKIASSEEFDICFTADWTNNYFQNISKGTFLDVGKLLPRYAPQKYASIPEWVWDGLKVNGRLYGVINGFIAWQDMFWFRKDLVEKYNFDYRSIKKLSDIEPFLEAVKKGDTSMVPFPLTGACSPDQNFMYSEVNIDAVAGVSLPGVIRRDDDSLKVLNQYEIPEYVEILKTLHRWYVNGYINKDAATSKDNSAIIIAKKSAAGFDAAYYEGKAADYSESLGMEAVITPLRRPHITPDSILKTINAISVTSKNPERAMMLLELSNTDRTLFRILGAGVEGLHYTDIGNNYIDIMPDSRYKPWNNWAWGDLDRNGYLIKGQPPSTAEDKANSGANGEPSRALGFGIDNEPVKTELAQIQTVISAYFPQLITGTVDPEKVLPEFNAKLKSAGLDKYLAEIQRQLISWKAAKK